MSSQPETQLPDKFKLIKTLSFIELRTKLTWTITSIFALLKPGILVAVPMSLQYQINRYLAYLTQSCKDKDTLAKRAKWLSVYGHCVHLDLLRLKTTTHYKSENGRIDVQSELADLTINLILKVSEFKTTVQQQLSLDAEILRTLEKMTWTSFLINPSTTSHYYFEIMAKITALVEILNQYIANPLVIFEQDDFLLYELDLIDKKLSNLLLLQDEYSYSR